MLSPAVIFFPTFSIDLLTQPSFFLQKSDRFSPKRLKFGSHLPKTRVTWFWSAEIKRAVTLSGYGSYVASGRRDFASRRVADAPREPRPGVLAALARRSRGHRPSTMCEKPAFRTGFSYIGAEGFEPSTS